MEMATKIVANEVGGVQDDIGNIALNPSIMNLKNKDFNAKSR